jgi:hypothetical protein
MFRFGTAQHYKMYLKDCSQSYSFVLNHTHLMSGVTVFAYASLIIPLVVFVIWFTDTKLLDLLHFSPPKPLFFHPSEEHKQKVRSRETLHQILGMGHQIPSETEGLLHNIRIFDGV